MRLEEIGFYTLSDARARNAGPQSPMWRGEMLLTARCNFRCPYCRRVGEEMSMSQATRMLDLWLDDGLRHVRFSGGEPTLYDGLGELIRRAKNRGVFRAAVSTNGAASLDRYLALLDDGIDDFSVSLDACCASTASFMAGGRDVFALVISNIAALSRRTYVTVGVTVTEGNSSELENIIQLAHDLGVADIRVIPAAQYSGLLGRTMYARLAVRGVLASHPILRYRLYNASLGGIFRGIRDECPRRCRLVVDDSVVTGGRHYPCVIYLREGGVPIGNIGPGMREDRVRWSGEHDICADPICSANCLDVCVDYNLRAERWGRGT